MSLPKFESPEQLQNLIDKYFSDCDQNGEPYTITGLALAMDTTRRTLLDYEAKDAFSHTIKRAKERVHQYAEKSLFTGKNPAGPIFNLKNNFGWKDQQQVELSNPDGSLGGMRIAVCFVESSDELPEPAKQLPDSAVDAEFETLSANSGDD